MAKAGTFAATAYGNDPSPATASFPHQDDPLDIQINGMKATVQVTIGADHTKQYPLVCSKTKLDGLSGRKLLVLALRGLEARLGIQAGTAHGRHLLLPWCLLASPHSWLAPTTVDDRQRHASTDFRMWCFGILSSKGSAWDDMPAVSDDRQHTVSMPINQEVLTPQLRR